MASATIPVIERHDLPSISFPTVILPMTDYKIIEIQKLENSSKTMRKPWKSVRKRRQET